MLTIQEVAEKAGVSTATVSRMINDNACVSTKTRNKIQAVIDETGYSPARRSRRNGKNSKSDTLKHGNATLIWTTSQELQHTNTGRDMMQGLTEGLRSNNATLNVDYLDSSGYVPKSLIDANTDGIFLHGPGPNAESRAYFEKLPVIWLLQQGSKDYGDRVQPDHGHAGKMSFDHLVKVGCKRLCCVTTHSIHSEFSQTRTEAFGKWAKLASLPITILEHEYPEPHEATPTRLVRIAAEIAASFASLKNRPDGLFVASNLGPYLHMELSKINIIPMQDIYMIAGDTSVCVQFPLIPEPVSIRLSSRKLGQQAAEMLVMRKKNPDMPQVTCLLKPFLQIPD